MDAQGCNQNLAATGPPRGRDQGALLRKAWHDPRVKAAPGLAPLRGGPWAKIGKMLAIEAPKGPRKTQDRGISPGKGRFGSIVRGPLGQDRGKMLAIEAPKGPRKTQDNGISPGKGRFGSIARGPLGQDRGKMLAIEAPKGPRKTQDRGISPGQR